jgi:hypothetical protein
MFDGYELGQLVTVWVDDMDPMIRKKYQGKYGVIKEIIYTEQRHHIKGPSFIKVYFPEINKTSEWTTERIRLETTEVKDA